VANEPPADPPTREHPRLIGPHAAPTRAAQAALNDDFPTALRGYDRKAVDRYVEEVRERIAELEVTSSPRAAVQHALEELAEETRGILQQAHEAADAVTARARAEADDRLRRAESEAQEMRRTAEAQTADLKQSAKVLTEERQRLIGEVRATAQRLVELADQEEGRFRARHEQP
jgi:DivIVA domain-containing protein